jgi:pimeloyl-ACP methyl ester carboxylesterase
MRTIHLVLFSTFFFAGCAAPTGSAEEPLGSSESALDEALAASAPALPGDVTAALSGGTPTSEALDRLYTLEHYVPVGTDRRIHLTETFTLRSWLRWPHRTMLMLPGPLTTGDFLQIDVDGYRGRDLMARRGFFAVTADFEGTGKSSYPLDGRSVSTANQTEALSKVVRYLRVVRLTSKIDVLGESWGGGVAAELCADSLRVRSCVLASMLYKTPSSFADMTFRSPGFRAMLDSLPDGYLPTAPPFYEGLLARSTPAVQTWGYANLPGRYTTGPLYSAFDLPFFDPTIARAPGLIIQGELDPNQSIDDTRELARDYGPGARLTVLPGAGHIPRIEPAPTNTRYWSEVVSFVDP